VSLHLNPNSNEGAAAEAIQTAEPTDNPSSAGSASATGNIGRNQTKRRDEPRVGEDRDGLPFPCIQLDPGRRRPQQHRHHAVAARQPTNLTGVTVDMHVRPPSAPETAGDAPAQHRRSPTLEPGSDSPIRSGSDPPLRPVPAVARARSKAPGARPTGPRHRPPHGRWTPPRPDDPSARRERAGG